MGHGCHDCGCPNGCECPHFIFDIDDVVIVRNDLFNDYVKQIVPNLQAICQRQEMGKVTARQFRRGRFDKERGNRPSEPWYEVHGHWWPETALIRAIEVSQKTPNFRAQITTPEHRRVYEDLKPLYDIIDGEEGFPDLPKELCKVFGHSNLARLDFAQDKWTAEYTARVLSHIDAYAWGQLKQSGNPVSASVVPDQPLKAPSNSEEPSRWNQLELE